MSKVFKNQKEKNTKNHIYLVNQLNKVLNKGISFRQDIELTKTLSHPKFFICNCM